MFKLLERDGIESRQPLKIFSTLPKNFIGLVSSEGLLRPSLAYPRAHLTYLNQRWPCIEGGSPFGVEQCFAVSWVFICNCQVKRSSAFKVLPVQCMWWVINQTLYALSWFFHILLTEKNLIIHDFHTFFYKAMLCDKCLTDEMPELCWNCLKD